MEFDLTKTRDLNIDEYLDFSNYQNKNIKETKNIYVKGSIKLTDLDILKVNIHLTGDLILLDSITLEDINYPLDLNIEEEYDINEAYFNEYFKKNQNTLDIMAILWENIVLEVPIRLTKKNDALFSGDGWSMGSNKNTNDNIDPRLAKLADLLEEGKE